MAGDADIDTQLAALLDERAIRRVLADYCKAIDRADADALSACFHADASFDVGSFQATGAEVGRVITQKMQGANVTMMYTALTTETIELDGDVAWTESYHLSIRRNQQPDGAVLRWLGERYLDRFERRGGEWRIADRTILHDWDLLTPHVPAWVPGRFIDGKPSRDDLSYRHGRASQP